MIIEKIILENFNLYEGIHEFSFEKINLISGDNGSGKTTLGLDSLLFCIYGYSEKNLDELVFRGLDKCRVTIEIKNNEDYFIITRKYPTSVTIEKNGVELELVNSKEKTKYLHDLFGDIDYFRKFRMIDTQKGINILASGETSLKKSLFSINEGIFNSARKNLLGVKSERERYNRDKAVIYSLYPSEKRFDILRENNLKLNEKYNSLINEIRGQEIEYNKFYSQYNKVKGILEYNNRELSNIKNLGIRGDCPTCKQEVDKDIISTITEDFKFKIKNISEQLNILGAEVRNESSLLGKMKIDKDKVYSKGRKLEMLLLKLKGRLKQKDFIYTEKDILVTKQAIDELDNFSNYYLMRWLSSLEPIMNSVIEKIGYKIKFDVNEKDIFSPVLFKDKKQFSYKDLSGGQRIVLGISFQLSILLQRGESGIIVADEGFSELDEKNLDHVLELFNDLPFQLVCVLHRFTGNVLNLNLINLDEGVVISEKL